MSGDFDHMAYSGEKGAAYHVQSNGERANERIEGVGKNELMNAWAKHYKAVLGRYSDPLLGKTNLRRCQSRLALQHQN